jgi:hypothetical protein
LGLFVLLPYYRSYGAFSFWEAFHVNHFNLLDARKLAMAKSKNIIAFKYICFMNGLVKSGLQIQN